MPANKKEIIFSYRIPFSNQTLEFDEETIRVFKAHQQKSCFKEEGGMLFAEINLPRITIRNASVPSILDQRTKFSFNPCKNRRRRLIRKYFKRNLHFIGEWHTHPEHSPTPSTLDQSSMIESFCQSQHELNGFILAIVGCGSDDMKLWVSIHNNCGGLRLEEMEIYSPTAKLE